MIRRQRLLGKGVTKSALNLKPISNRNSTDLNSQHASLPTLTQSHVAYGLQMRSDAAQTKLL
jgi:hypothetical protein